MTRTTIGAGGSLIVLATLLSACGSVPTYQDSVIEPEPLPLPVHAPVAKQPQPIEVEAETPPAPDPTALETYPDLLARIRDGFVLTDVSHPAVDREASWYAKHPAFLDRTFRRGERYLYHIVEEIEARQMPLELALLPVVESAFNPVALSRSRASGLWQFIPSTGRRYGLKQNWYYDGRRDVTEATRAALDYLQFLSAEFDGDWLLAVAAYNAGERNVERAIQRNRRAGKPTDFFSLGLPRETRAYVPKLLAMRRLVASPESFGLAFSPIPNEPYFVKIDVGSQIDLDLAAELAGIPAEDFLALNPAFNRWVTDPEGPHHLLVPASTGEQFSTRVAAVPQDQRVRVAYYRVRSGDTLGQIARRHGTTVRALQVQNGIKGTLIHPGQELVVRAPAGGVARTAALNPAAVAASRPTGASSHRVRRGDTLWDIARTYRVDVNALAQHNGLATADTLAIGRVLAIPSATLAATGAADAAALQPLTYTVKRGDTLSRISRQFRVSVNDLMSWNSLSSAHRIKPGQRLVVYVDDRSRAGG